LRSGKASICGGRDVCNFANSPLDPERQADAFAPDLTLPNYLRGPRLRRIKRPTLAAAREIAEEYSASLTATLFKMTVVNRFPIIIACYDKTRRRWFERAPMIQPWWFPVDLLDRGTFAANMLFGDAGEENFPRKMPAEAWFGFKGCDRFEVEEQSFRLPGDEILTVLKLPDAAVARGRELTRQQPRRCRKTLAKRIFGSQIVLKNAKVGPPWCSTVVLHRQNPAVREAPDFEGLFRYRKSVAEREGLSPTFDREGYFQRY
jgi:hypothetical protein